MLNSLCRVGKNQFIFAVAVVVLWISIPTSSLAATLEFPDQLQRWPHIGSIAVVIQPWGYLYMGNCGQVFFNTGILCLLRVHHCYIIPFQTGTFFHSSDNLQRKVAQLSQSQLLNADIFKCHLFLTPCLSYHSLDRVTTVGQQKHLMDHTVEIPIIVGGCKIFSLPVLCTFIAYTNKTANRNIINWLK